MKMTLETAESFIEQVAGGARIDALIREHGGGYYTFWRILADHPELERRYAMAQAGHAELMASEMLDIADTDLDAGRARNRLETRKWLAARYKPQKYGDRIELNVTGTIDLTAAIAEAQSRRGASVVPAPHDTHPHLIDITPNIEVKATDCKSVDALEKQDAGDSTPPDPFS